MTKPTTSTTSQRAAEDVASLLRARNPLIWIVSKEEARVERYLIEAAAAAKYIPRTWDAAAGVCEMSGKTLYQNTMPIEAAIDRIRADSLTGSVRQAFILRDLPVWLEGAMGALSLRALRNLLRILPRAEPIRRQSLIVLSPNGKVPPELADLATVIEWPLPDRAEIEAILDGALKPLEDDMRETAAPKNGERDAAIDAAVGLTGEEALSCYVRSLVQLKRIDPATVASEKRRVIAREGILEWFEPLKGGIDSVGGLDNLKDWLKVRKSAYSAEAREYGLPAPRGMMLVGISGCGKSLTAKAVGTAWQFPLLRLDMGALKSKFVGESEGNLRKALKVVESVGRCVLWLDEIEKALAGATQGAADGGVAADAMGALLTWMQDRKGEAFIIATANDVSALPPEMLRKGRWDELWFVDLPGAAERLEILASAMRQHGRPITAAQIGDGKIAGATNGFTGSEIAALVPDAMFKAFADGKREITEADLLEAAASVSPLSNTAREKIEGLREWAKTRARRASKIETTTELTDSRGIDF